MKEGFTDTNFGYFLNLILDYVVFEIEKRILFKKKFSFLGAVQFDKDIKIILEFFQKNSPQKSIRNKFSRITQMASLLNLTKVK